MSGRVELDVTLRHDPDEPATAGACTLTAGASGGPVVVVRDLLTVDETRLGHLVAMLLADAAMEQEAER